MSPVRKNFIANSVSKFTRIAFTLILIPIYIANLGEEKYADWILLFSLPALFEITNFGINQAVNNTFSIYYNRNYNDSNKIIISGLCLTLTIGVIVSLSIFFLWDLLEVHTFLNLTIINTIDSKWIVVLLTIKVFSDMVKGILCSYFFAQNKNHINVYIDLIQYSVENLIIVSFVVIGFELVFLSNIYIIPSLIVCVLLLFYNNISHSLSISKDFMQLKFIKILIKPSSSFSLLTISEYVLNQGFIIIFKKYFNSQELIIFNASKTLVNYLKTIQGLIASSVFPVFNVYFGKKQLQNLRRIFKKSNNTTIILSLILSCLLAFFGSLIWDLWIGGSIAFNEELFYFLILIQIISSFWIIPSNLIVSINKHFTLSILYLTSSLLSLISFYIVVENLIVSIALVPIFYLFHQLIMLYYCNSKIKKIIN